MAEKQLKLHQRKRKVALPGQARPVKTACGGRLRAFVAAISIAGF